MDSLLYIVKEQGIVDIIEEYKNQMEKLDLEEKIKKNNGKINDIRKLCQQRIKIIKKSVKEEIENTQVAFLPREGNSLPLNGYYRRAIKNSYIIAFDNLINKKLDILREKNIELQMEKLLKYGEDDEDLLEIIDDNSSTIDIGTTGHNNLNGITFGYNDLPSIGVTGYENNNYNVNDINLGVTY